MQVPAMEVLAIASLALLFIALPATIESAAASKLPPIALDSTGSQLLPGVRYYAVLADGNRGGLGLAPASPRNPCPLDVVVDLSPTVASSGGLPFNFSQLNSNDTSPIRTSTDINIVSAAAASICLQSTAWKLGKFEGETGKWYLTTGGTLGKPGVATVSSWFRLERVNAVDGPSLPRPVYKVVFCPHVCRYCKVVCGDIGVVGGDTLKRKLGISTVPLLLTFRKA